MVFRNALLVMHSGRPLIQWDLLVTLRTISLLLSHNHPLNHVWSLLDAYSLLFPSAKVCFGSNYRILRSKRKPQHNAIIFIFDVLIWSSDHEVWSLTAQRNVLNMCIFAKNILLPCQRQLFCVSLKKQCTCFSSIPCKIRTGILVGSRRDLGGNPAGIPARFWPPGFFFPAGISPRSRQDSRQKAKFPAAKISPGSCRETRRDSRREANSWWQKSQCDLAGNLAKIGDGKQNCWWDSLPESRQNFRHAATNFFWIEPNVYVLEIN